MQYFAQLMISGLAIGAIGLFNVVGSYASGVIGGRGEKRIPLSIIYLLRSIAIADGFVARKGGLEGSRGLTSSQPRLVLASLLVRTGQTEEAMSLYAKVLASHRGEMATGKTVYPLSRRRYCEALAGQARLMPSGSSAWQEIIARLGPVQAGLSPEESTLLAEAYAHGGPIEPAAALTTPLYASGYRHPDFMAVLDRFPALRQATR